MLRRTWRRFAEAASLGVESDTLPENSYRVPQERAAFLNTLPLPKFKPKLSPMVQKKKEFRELRKMLRTPMHAPKPQWFDGMTQAQLYDSCLSYTEQQLLDMRLYKSEDIKSHPADRNGFMLHRVLLERVQQPAFKSIAPNAEHLAESQQKLPPGLAHIVDELQTAPPSLLPHPALALHGESLARSAVVGQIVKMFPRVHSAHLESLVRVKLSLSNIVEAAIRIGLARGMGLAREVRLFKRVETINGLYAKYERMYSKMNEEIKAGRVTGDLQTPRKGLQIAADRRNRLPMREEHMHLLEERMKLLSRHMFAVLAFGGLTKGDKFVETFVLRYLMPDVLTQYYSSDPSMRSWLEVGHRWSFAPWQTDRQLLPLPREGNTQVPMVIGGVETHADVVAPTVQQMLTSENPMKELELVTRTDPVATQMLGGERLRYKELFRGHTGSVGEMTYRVGVFSGETLLGEGDGASYELAAKAAAQNTLFAYFMNPKANWSTLPDHLQHVEGEEDEVEDDMEALKEEVMAAAEPSPLRLYTQGSARKGKRRVRGTVSFKRPKG
eukprot:Hpha_TRINITY_DN15036_c1_g2::TRINITY_DN15036_c1_g2_i1::g.123291::m.123291